MSEMSHFPVRLMSFLHSTFKTKCKYPVFTVIATKMTRCDSPCKKTNTGSKHCTSSVAHARGPSSFDVYGPIELEIGPISNWRYLQFSE